MSAFAPPEPRQRRRQHAQCDEDARLQAVHFRHQPIDVVRAVLAQVNPNGHGNQRGQPVHNQKAQIRYFAADAGGNENGSPQTRQETGDKQNPVAVFVEFFLNLRVTFRRHDARNRFELEDFLPQMRPAANITPSPANTPSIPTANIICGLV